MIPPCPLTNNPRRALGGPLTNNPRRALGCPLTDNPRRALGRPLTNNPKRALGCPLTNNPRKALGSPLTNNPRRALGRPLTNNPRKALGCPLTEKQPEKCTVGLPSTKEQSAKSTRPSADVGTRPALVAGMSRAWQALRHFTSTSISWPGPSMQQAVTHAQRTLIIVWQTRGMSSSVPTVHLQGAAPRNVTVYN